MRKSRSSESYPYLFAHPVDPAPGPIERRARRWRSRFPAGQPTVAFDPAHENTFLERRTAARPNLDRYDERAR